MLGQSRCRIDVLEYFILNSRIEKKIEQENYVSQMHRWLFIAKWGEKSNVCVILIIDFFPSEPIFSRQFTKANGFLLGSIRWTRAMLCTFEHTFHCMNMCQVVQANIVLLVVIGCVTWRHRCGMDFNIRNISPFVVFAFCFFFLLAHSHMELSLSEYKVCSDEFIWGQGEKNIINKYYVLSLQSGRANSPM